MEKSAPDVLTEQYDSAMSIVGSDSVIKTDLENSDKIFLDLILEHSEDAKGVLTVFITSIVYKILHPEQDVRNHQDSIENGYSGRNFDKKYITPFLKQCKFPAMAESGWLTRSLEQKIPYNKDYTGAIKPDTLKSAFLLLIANIQSGSDCIKYLSYLFQGLIIKRNSQVIDLAKPTTLSINSILTLLNSHFGAVYKSEGASRLPVLAFYAVYQCLINEAKRFDGKELLPIESHTSADKRSGRIGDIEIIDDKKRPYEAVEVKHGLSITLDMVKTAYEKFATTPVNRYYILSTAPPSETERESIHQEIQRIKNVHGCQLITNGIMESLQYYLRLLGDTFEFVNNYVNLLENDGALKYEHKEKWNALIGSMK